MSATDLFRQGEAPVVSVVVLTWNRRDLTLGCLDSLMASTYPADRLHVIVVDNGSADGTVQAIQSRYGRVTVLANSENLGFAAGNNVGICHAMQTVADYVMLLNNDTVVDACMLQHLIAAAENDSSVGIVTPKIYYYDHPDLIWCAGASIDWRTGATRRLRAEQPDGNKCDVVSEVDFASGCALCVRRKVIDQIGLLDSRFFFYYEETDWCVRACAAGWRIIHVPRAHVWHKVSATIGTTSLSTIYYMNRNLFLFLSKHREGLRGSGAVALAGARLLLAVAACTVKSGNRTRLPGRDVQLLALRDAILRRWGKMGPDVVAAVNRKQK